MRDWKTLVWTAVWAAVMGLLLTGCSRPGDPDSGARRVAQKYLDAFRRQDWPEAYGVLDATVRGRLSADQFSQWAGAYRKRLGFTVESCFVPSCEEVGDRAIANATLGGHAGAREITKNDVVTLHRGAGGWGVVPPASAMPTQVNPAW